MCCHDFCHYICGGDAEDGVSALPRLTSGADAEMLFHEPSQAGNTNPGLVPQEAHEERGIFCPYDPDTTLGGYSSKLGPAG